MIYAIGNSHAHFFTGSHPGSSVGASKDFTSVSIGPVIAYNFVENHLRTVLEWLSDDCMVTNFGTKFDLDRNKVLLVVGEVDCRWHIPFQAHQLNLDVIEVAKICINRFFRVHMFLRERGVKVIAWGGHPSTNSGHNPDPASPVYGDCLKRNRTSLFWSDYLAELSNYNGVPFVSICRDLIDSNGYTQMQYFEDYCHLNSAKLLKLVTERFHTQGLI